MLAPATVRTATLSMMEVRGLRPWAASAGEPNNSDSRGSTMNLTLADPVRANSRRMVRFA